MLSKPQTRNSKQKIKKSMSARENVIRLLEKWEKSDVYADILLDQLFQKSALEPSDRALVQEIFFGVLRWKNQLDWIIKQFFQGEISRAPRFVRFILQTGIYQLLYLERVPDYAIVNEAVRLARKRGGNYWARKINGILRNFIRKSDQVIYPDAEKDTIEYISVRFSHPRWLVQRWVQRWGASETIRLCEANNERPKISLRRNRLRISVEEFADYLTENEIEFQQFADVPDFFLLESFSDVAGLEHFRKGFFSIQDASAGLPCILLDPKPGDKILDLCAAPGGKSGYLMELSSGEAKVYSVDLNFFRLGLVKKNLQRLNFPVNRLIQADATNFSCKKMDKILIDVPCSGLGVLAKRVDLRWRRTVEEMAELPDLQLAILENAAKLLRSGGAIVYSTCTIEPQENEHVVEKFLHSHSEFKIESADKFITKKFVHENGWVQTYPHRHGIDGAFAVKLIKS